MIINLVYDSQAQAAPGSFKTAMQAAVDVLEAAFTDAITINVSVGYGEYRGGALPNQNTSEGGAVYDSISYADLRTALANSASSADDNTSVASLPTGTSIGGHSTFSISRAEEKALGVGDPTPNDSVIDGYIGMGTAFGDATTAAALHEITHAMGRIFQNAADVSALFRYSSPGFYVFSAAIPAQSSYFSIDGGNTRLADYGTASDPGDFLNPPGSNLTQNDPFNESVGNGRSLTSEGLTAVDVLGFDRDPHFLAGDWRTNFLTGSAPGYNTIHGNGGDDYITGGGDGDRLYGGDGEDTLNAFGYSTLMQGGAGDDDYFVGDWGGQGSNTLLVENPGEGFDTVHVESTFRLPDNFEDLTLSGSGNFDATGNAQSNTIAGNSGNNTLDGGAGSDTLRGNSGDDTYHLFDVTNGAYDTVVENGGDFGNDTVLVEDVSSSVRSYAMTANVENGAIVGHNAHDFALIGNDLDNNLYDDIGSNVLYGGGGRDTLNGGDGIDRLYGGEGDDTFELQDRHNGAYDQAIETATGGAHDHAVVTPVHEDGYTDYYALPVYVETAEVLGSMDFELLGNPQDDTLYGNSGANTLYDFDGDDKLLGYTGDDTLIGGAGDDSYFLEDLTYGSGVVLTHYDAVVEEANAGIDEVDVRALDNPDTFSDGYTLGDNVENGVITGSLAFYLAGNELNNTLKGNAAANALYGEDGDDTLNGKAGADTLEGGAGDDTFVYAPGYDADTITDFTAGGTEDKIDLNGFTGIRSFASVQSRAMESNGNTVLDFGNGDTLTLDGIAKASLSAADFIGLALPPSDFNADAMSDLLWQNDNGRVSIWEMNGATTIANPTLGVNPGPAWHTVATGDFNADGKADILWQNDSGAVSVWEMNGASVLANPTLGVNPGPAWHVIGTGDFNDDGKADILWQNDNGAVSVWEMNGTSVIANPTLSVNPGPAWHVIGTGDFNDDGKSDILWQNNNGAVSIWEMNGVTPIANPTLATNPGSAWHVKDAGDFNADGDSDILWQNTNGAVSIWEMNGASVITNPTLATNPGPAWHVVNAADYNGDAHADISWQNDNGAVSIWEMDGADVLANPTLGVNPGPSWHVIGPGHGLVT